MLVEKHKLIRSEPIASQDHEGLISIFAERLGVACELAVSLGDNMIKQTNFKTWSEFKRLIFDKLFLVNPIQRGRFLFRGQKNPEWKLSSTFDRSFLGVKGGKRSRIEQELINHFKQECQSESNLKELLTDEVSTLALAQHFGLPTRLLDWSESPYVAAFFAFQHAVFAFQGTIDSFCPEENVAIWALDSNHYIWSESQGVQIVSPPTWENTRMRNQSGKFTLSRTPFRSLQEYVENCEDADEALQLFLIPGKEAQKAIADLDLMGINNGTMFPDLGGKAKAAISKVVLGAKTRES